MNCKYIADGATATATVWQRLISLNLNWNRKKSNEKSKLISACRHKFAPHVIRVFDLSDMLNDASDMMVW